MVVIDTRIPLDSQFPVYVLADSSQFVLCSCIYFTLFPPPVFSIELTFTSARRIQSFPSACILPRYIATTNWYTELVNTMNINK